MNERCEEHNKVLLTRPEARFLLAKFRRRKDRAGAMNYYRCSVHRGRYHLTGQKRREDGRHQRRRRSAGYR